MAAAKMTKQNPKIYPQFAGKSDAKIAQMAAAARKDAIEQNKS